MSTNKITKEQYPDIWDCIIEDEYDSVKDHRKNSNFFTTLYFLLEEEDFPNNPELWGYWESDTVIWDDNNGLEDNIDVLYRVEKKEKVVTTTVYKRV